jgi:predicted CxxxxCH...CXXCH cytochrome family protein
LAFNNAEDFIHGAPDYDGVCEICHTQTNYYRNSADGNHTHNAGTNCLICHSHLNGFMSGAGGGSCNGCHGAPPASGAHGAHFGGTVEQASYGTVENLSTPDTYIYSCGTCHPSSSSSYHNNGTVDLELYDPSAPAGTIKSLNPAEASYDPATSTCSNVYCHSATTWSSTTVGTPIMESNVPVLDGNGNLTYPPYTVTEAKQYVAMNWDGSSLDCNGCHRNGPQTSVPTVSAGVGQSHGWIDDWGYEDLHAWNMASDPLTCRTCHYNTVTAEQTWSRDSWDITTYDDVVIADRSHHVNGMVDVLFDPVNTVAVRDSVISLAASSYDVNSRTCSSVPCHLEQLTPEWGKPYRWWETAECDQCHNYTGWFGNERSMTSPSNHIDVTNHNCIDCHNRRELHR